MNLDEYQQIQPHVNAHGLSWLTPNTHCAWRVETLMTKETDTIAWINAMEPGDTLYDVGANMGQYSLLAAKRGIHVHAFEPESQNFALLCRNIALNKLGDRITPWPLALTDNPGFDSFFVTSLIAGNSCNSFGESVDYHLQPKTFSFTQGCYGATLNDFIKHRIPPTHIKIDVDGFEHKVIMGGEDALRTAKSVLIETNRALAEHHELSLRMRELGFEPDIPTAEAAMRKDGPFANIGNIIYYRKGA